MILLLDNYDSFTYNLYQYLSELGADVEVVRNDTLTVDDALARRPAGIVISPGPGRPEDAGISVPLVRAAAGKTPLLGVCLGHQAIGVAFGGTIARASELMHGKTSVIHHDGSALYNDIPAPFTATRYHSLVLARDSVPTCLTIDAWTDDGTVMGVHHATEAICGVQFHPESILSQHGKQLLGNFVQGLA